MFLDNGAREQAWDKNLQLLLVLIIGFNTLPHLQSIPVWATTTAFAFLSWKVLSLWRGVPRPPRWLLYPVSLVCAIGVFHQYGTILGQEPAAALLVTLASAKLLETNRYRDAMFIIFTSFFLLMAHLLDSQSILTTIFMAVDVMLITALMFQLHKQERRRSPRSFRPVMKTLALAIPVWMFLFVIFPRFSTGLWGQQEKQNGGGGGFSDSLDPGGIETLVDSDQVAFHVTFEGGVRPQMSDMYWRGGILTVADGLKWTKSHERLPSPDILVPSSRTGVGVSTNYQVYLESRFSPWLFALDYPTALSAKGRGLLTARRRQGFVFETTHAASGAVVYEGSSLRSALPQRLLAQDRKMMLQLPAETDPRILQLASRLASEAASKPLSDRFPTPADRLAFQVEDWFDKQGFRYTKSPGSLNGSGSEQLAEFLFARRTGFCEHYAAAFATLMRAAGVPARVTVGFMGVSRNQYSEFYVVRDLDAHAWAEIWRDDASKPGIGRWVRVDPTAMIAPLRVRMGGEFNLLDPATYSRDLSAAEVQLALRIRQNALFYKASMAWDALQMKWNSFLSDFDFDFQRSLLEALGLKGITRWTLFGIASLGVLIFALSLHWSLRKRAHRVDPALIVWRQFCKKLGRAGVTRFGHEGPVAFTERAAQIFPAEATRLRALGLGYALLRYGPSVRGARPEPANADKHLPSTVPEFRREMKSLRLEKP